MHSKLATRVITYTCILVLGTAAVLLGFNLHFSKDGWSRILEYMSRMGSYSFGDIKLEVDSCSVTDKPFVTVTGQITASDDSVIVQCLRLNDLGAPEEVTEAGEQGCVKSRYDAEITGETFSVSDVYLKNGSNRFLIIASCENGSVALENIELRYNLGNIAATLPEEIAESENGMLYQSNTLVLTFSSETSPEREIDIIAETGGAETGHIAVMHRYQVRYSPMTMDEITSFCKDLTEKYEEILTASPEAVIPLALDSMPEPNDPFDDIVSTQGTDWNESVPAGNNWGLECIQALTAWNEYDPYFRSIAVGVVDIGFADGHDDLRLYYVNEDRQDDDHGAHIAGIIGAVHDNETGIAGVLTKGRVIACPLCANMNEDGSFYCNTSQIAYAVADCITSGASVINISLGRAGGDIFSAEDMLYTTASLSETMAALLRNGYDFVITQAAGNGDENGYAVPAVTAGIFNYVRAAENGMPDNETQIEWEAFCNVLRHEYGISFKEISDRVIVAGACRNMSADNPYFELDAYSNCGDMVDIAAPGTDIYSTVPGGVYGDYAMMSGTSMAAPYVAAVAAMTWSANGELRGSDIRKLLVENTAYTASSPCDGSMPGYSYPVVNAPRAVAAALAFERHETKAVVSVRDAQNNAAVESAAIHVYAGVEAGGEEIGIYYTGADGSVEMTLNSGDYILDIEKDSYIPLRAGALHLTADNVSRATYALSHELNENEFRIVLTWGASPKDLDSHLTGSDSAGRKLHVFYHDKTHTVNGAVYAELDVDDRDSFGPETITLHNLPQSPLLYSVHDYSNKNSISSMALSGSMAIVNVYRGAECIATYTVENNHKAVCWDVFRIMPDGSLETVDIYHEGPMAVDMVGQ